MEGGGGGGGGGKGGGDSLGRKAGTLGQDIFHRGLES